MKKIALIACILFYAFTSLYAQNYRCLQSGVKHFYTNSNGYLRGIRIDSVKTYADSTVFYPFHTPRGTWVMSLGLSTSLDSNGGSWLGKHVVMKPDGMFLFDNLWGDTVTIKSQASVGDSWLFYRDTSGLYYIATVTSTDTLTSLGIMDSVKTITIHAYQDSILTSSDALNGFTILLSKSSGFVQVFDLYTFPYHPAGWLYSATFSSRKCFSSFRVRAIVAKLFNLPQRCTLFFHKLLHRNIIHLYEINTVR